MSMANPPVRAARANGGGQKKNKHKLLKQKRQAATAARAKPPRSKRVIEDLSKKLHHSLQVLIRKAKKARAFEIQRIIKKIRADATRPASTSHAPRVMEEMQEILVALKAIDLEDFCKYALHTKLEKDRSNITENPEIKAWMEDTLATHSFTPVLAGDVSVTGKSQNRLAGSKTFSDCLKTTVIELKDRLALHKRPSMTADEARSRVPKDSLDKASGKDNEVVSGSDDDEDDAALIASSSEGDSDAEEIDIPEAVSVDDDEEVLRHLQDTESEGSEIDSSADQDDEQSIVDRKSTKRKLSVSVSPPPNGRVAASAFLPSLSTGYVAGDPDGSVYSYSDDDGDAKPQRKNRRGQRARQAIWERKYGKKANHVVNKQKREVETEENRQRTRAEKEIDALRKSGRYVPGADSNLTKLAEGKHARAWATEPKDDADIVLEQEVKEADKALHPSWEAKKRAKEAANNLPKNKGKKIRFD